MARVLLSLLLLLSLLAPHVAVQAQLDGVEYELFIACPGADGFTFSLNTGGGCPVRAVDGQDVMGAPSLAVDPHEPNNLIIASLHGGVYKRGSGGPSFFAVGAQSCPEPGPTPKSRCGQAFTTFTSTDSGAYWVDNPFVPPQKLGFRAFGEHPQVTIDPYGRAYVGSLYAVPEGGSFRYVIAAQKFSSLETINEEQDGEYALKYIEPLFNRSSISQMWYIYNPATDNMTVVWHEAPQGPASRGGASFTPSAARLTGAVWAESGPAGEGEAPATAARSAIGLVWTTPRPNATYHRTPASESIGPCLRSTNPVLEDGYIYIGCQVDASAGPFPWNPKAADGQVELFRMHPDGGKPQYMGSSPVVGGSPKLGVRSDGRLALLSTAPGEDGMLQLYGAFGSYDARSGRIEWGRLSHYAPEFRVPNPAERVVRSNIQDLVYREYSGVVHLILRETVEPSGIGTAALQQALGPKVRKSIVAIDENHGFLKELKLDIGNPLNRTDPALLDVPEEAFEDLSDDFLQLPPAAFSFQGRSLGDTYQREFFAVGDYGIIQFAELIEVTTLRFAPAALAPTVVPAVPAAATATATAFAPVFAGVLAGVLALAMFANRRKNPAAALARMKK